MTQLKEYIKLLEDAAQALRALDTLTAPQKRAYRKKNETASTAKKIIAAAERKTRKKLHWTQTPEGRKRLAEQSKAMWRKRGDR